MTLLTYTGLVLTLATIHEYVPYKCSTMLIIAGESIAWPKILVYLCHTM